jgi:arsenite methyltransferase
MSEVVFDEALGKRLEALYATADIRRRRRLVREALAVAPGECILDIGCGPGFYVLELLDEVGPGGSVVGVDASPAMLALAQRRCQGRANVTFHQGTANSLPVKDAEFDAALCVQVLEYVPDATEALIEMHRALRPGGRLVVWDIDFATVTWHSSDPDRMDRVLMAFDEHLVHRSLPRTMPARLRAAGFGDVGFEGHTFATAELSPDFYGAAIISLIEDFVPGRQGVSAEETAAWAAEQRHLGESGEFFFSCTQFCFTATA